MLPHATGPGLSGIFRMHRTDYLRKRIGKVSRVQYKAIRDIMHCRTSALGGHVYECDNCNIRKIAYNSCRNRHCPKCQFIAKEEWIARRKDDLLPVPYFHIVFTIPASLRAIAYSNQRLIYNMIFKAASETLREAALNPKNMGAEIGFISILHTWGQNLMYHPHLHCVVPGGGLHPEKQQWIASRKQFFISIRILSKLFRGKFLNFLQNAYKEGQISFHGSAQPLGESNVFQALCNSLWQKQWVVYAKPPFGGPEQVISYLGRYTHRIAISNKRILSMNTDNVTFLWRDYADNNHNKTMTLHACEFIRRFLMHVLPRGFMRIRHYGILSNRNRREKIHTCRKLLQVQIPKIKPAAEPETWEEKLFNYTGIDITVCTVCGKGHMFLKQIIYRGESYPDTS